MSEKKPNIPQKGAGRKWAARLKELAQQDPPDDLVDRLNGKKEKAKKIASPENKPEDLES